MLALLFGAKRSLNRSPISLIRSSVVVIVKLVLDTSLPSTEETALELRKKLKMKMIDSEQVKVLEVELIECVAPDLLPNSAGSERVN